MTPDITFVIGANGVGKSTVMTEVKKLLLESKFELYDFDERGVPNNADKTWRLSETNHWISLGKTNQKLGISTVIFGFTKPEEINERAKIILLDGNKNTIEKRIRGRYLTEESLKELIRTTGKSIEKFVMDNIYTSSLLRKRCKELGCQIIATDEYSPTIVAAKVVESLKQFQKNI